MRYCIAYIADDKIQEYFKNTCRDISDRFKVFDLSQRVPAHITLKYPFELDGANDLADLELRIKKVSESFSSTPFNTNGISRFDDNKKTIFLDIEHDVVFVKNMTSLLEAIGDFDEDRKFGNTNRKYHISLVRNLDDEMSDQILEYIKSLPEPSFSSSINNISIMEFVNEKWNVKYMYKLL